MKQQVVVIHGGDSFATYEEAWNALIDAVLNIDRLRFFDWKSTLREMLGEAYDVIQPRMPNPQNAKYKEWKLWFEKLVPQLDEKVILVGHSLGGSFLAKYLSENVLPKQIVATLLVAPPFDTDSGRRLIEFDIINDLATLKEQGGAIFLYHSEDDPIVDFSELTKFLTHLPNAHSRTFTDRQHFNQMEFPELLEDIRSLG